MVGPWAFLILRHGPTAAHTCRLRPLMSRVNGARRCQAGIGFFAGRPVRGPAARPGSVENSVRLLCARSIFINKNLPEVSHFRLSDSARRRLMRVGHESDGRLQQRSKASPDKVGGKAPRSREGSAARQNAECTSRTTSVFLPALRSRWENKSFTDARAAPAVTRIGGQRGSAISGAEGRLGMASSARKMAPMPKQVVGTGTGRASLRQSSLLEATPAAVHDAAPSRDAEC